MQSVFQGLKVLDVGSWIAGPVAATIMADYGAEVIKIEMPGVGDQYRLLSETPGVPDADANYCWQMDARNKRSLTLNLKRAEGIAILRQLVEASDVYITNQPLPMRRALGLNYEDIQAINPAIIYASLTAYGEKGPDRDGEGFDLVAYWARSGLMDLVRDASAKPAMALPGMGDHPTAVSLYASIVTALLHRERTGEGSMVHTSLLGNGLWSAACIAQAGFAGGDYERYRAFKAEAGFGRFLYECQDGRFVQLTMIRTQEEFEQFLAVTQLTSVLTDPRFLTPELRIAHGAELVELVAARLKDESASVWMKKCEAAGVPMNRVQTIEETLTDPQVRVNEMTRPAPDDMAGMAMLLNHPVNVEGLPRAEVQPAPDLGADAAAILSELGYAAGQIEDLRASGVV